MTVETKSKSFLGDDINNISGIPLNILSLKIHDKFIGALNTLGGSESAHDLSSNVIFTFRGSICCNTS